MEGKERKGKERRGVQAKRQSKIFKILQYDQTCEDSCRLNEKRCDHLAVLVQQFCRRYEMNCDKQTY